MTVTALDGTPSNYGLTSVLRAEWTKLWSLRSTLWTLLVTFAGSIGVTLLATNSAGHHPPPWYQGFDATNTSLAGLMVAVLAIGVLGVLAVTGEYGSGTMRATLSAAPRRPLLLAAKTLVVGVVTLVAGEALSFACFGVGQAMLAHGGAPTASLGHAAVLRAVTLSGAFLALLAVGAVGLGLALRHTAGGIAAYAGLTFLLPVVLQRLPSHPGRYTPMLILANSVAAVRPQGDTVSPTTGFVLMGLYATAAAVLGGVLLVRRDA